MYNEIVMLKVVIVIAEKSKNTNHQVENLDFKDLKYKVTKYRCNMMKSYQSHRGMNTFLKTIL